MLLSSGLPAPPGGRHEESLCTVVVLALRFLAVGRGAESSGDADADVDTDVASASLASGFRC